MFGFKAVVFAIPMGLVAGMTYAGVPVLCTNHSPAPGLSTGTTANNGTLAPAGKAWSELQNNTGNTTESNGSAGFGCQRIGTATDNRCVDDFFVPEGGWTISSIDLFGYQTNAPASPSPFASVNVQIWGPCADGVFPGDVGCTVVGGDTTTNRLSLSSDTNLFRLFNSSVPAPGIAVGTTRIIWQNTASFSTPIALTSPGRYWVDFQLEANPVGSGGNFAPAITVPGARGLAGWNARQKLTGATFVPVVDTGNPAAAPDVPQDFPFVLYGAGTPASSTCGVAPPLSDDLFAHGFEN